MTALNRIGTRLRNAFAAGNAGRPKLLERLLPFIAPYHAYLLPATKQGASAASPSAFTGALDIEELTLRLYPLSAADKKMRERVKALLAESEFAPREGLALQAQAELSYARFKRLRDELGLRIRDAEERPARLASVLDLVAAVDGTLFTVMSIHYCLCGGSLLRFGSSSPEIQRYIEELDTLETIGTFLVTELGYGNNVASLQTRADYDPDTGDIILSTPSAEARKFMPNTGLANVPKLGVVMARLHVRGVEHGVVPIVVRLRTSEGACPGINIAPLGEKPGYALDNAMTSFDRVRVSRHCLLLGDHSRLHADGAFHSEIRSRRERFLLSIEQVQLGRLCLSAASATVAGASAFIAIAYGEQRRTFAPRRTDVAILDYRNHQRDVLSALAGAYASRLLVNAASREYEAATTRDHDATFRITSATKVHVSYATERAIRLCRERCGAAGLFEENRLSVYAAQCGGIITAEGDNQIALIKIARQMLLRQGYKPLTDKPNLSGTMRECERLLGLLRERERRLLNELRRSMAAARILGGSLFELWNENINLAIETATAHAARLAADVFWQEARTFGETHAVRELFRLFAYQELAPYLGYFLAEGLMTREEVKHHGKTLDRACQLLRPVALDLAKAFDVPNELLRAPIASGDYIQAYDARARELRGKF
jgi:acyl-CoA oxidase